MELNFWKGKKVFITGHTGFKGSWLSLVLTELGAEVAGYSLPAETESLWNDFGALKVKSILADIRDMKSLSRALTSFNPEIIFHAAAQPLVIESLRAPLETFSSNINGTINVLEAARSCTALKVLVNITTDKVYENASTGVPFRESDNLGGSDPYSTSKACSELVTKSYRESFFKDVKIATARAGNIIGGGDRGLHRLFPDIVRALESHSALEIRSPESIRPWQHVLDVIRGYLDYAHYLWKVDNNYVTSMNFSPSMSKTWTVKQILQFIQSEYPGLKLNIKYVENQFKESPVLVLDSSLAERTIGWKTRLTIEESIRNTIQWFFNEKPESPLFRCKQELSSYLKRK